MENVILVQHIIFIIAMIVLAFAIIFCLIRAVTGPRITDRLIAINLIGTKTIMFICILALYLNEKSIIDVALVYAIISFLAVVVLVNVTLAVYKKKKAIESGEVPADAFDEDEYEDEHHGHEAEASHGVSYETQAKEMEVE